jgi:flagellin
MSGVVQKGEITRKVKTMAVTISAGVRSALTALQSSQAAAQITQTRLATGKKVNSALDNPSSFFTASGLNNRGSDLSRLLDDMGQSVKTLEAADKGIQALAKLVETAQSVAKQAQASTATNLKATGSVNLSGSNTITGAGDLVLKVGGTTKTIALLAADTGAQVVTKINAAGGVKASLDSTGNLNVEALGGESLEVDAATDAIGTGLSTGVVARASGDVNASRKALAAQFDDLRKQIDELSKDSGYNGVNLLGGDSQKITFNEKATSTLTVKGVTLDSTGLGVGASSDTFQSDSSIKTAIDALSTASTTLRTQASIFGSALSIVQNRQDFTRGLINTLTAGADALTLADSSEEGANLLALNTRAQLSQTALSLANQADSAVLRLF